MRGHHSLDRLDGGGQVAVFSARRRGVSLALAFAVVLACASGCINPNTYSTPRTTPVGQVQNAMAAEIVSYRAETPESSGRSHTDTGNTLVAPSYFFRVGLTDRLDIGGRFANGSALGVDLKWNFLKSEVFDMAVAPGTQAFYAWGGAGSDGGYTHVYTNLPLLFGINASPEFTIAPSIGVGYGFNAGSEAYNNAEERIASTEALMLQAGIGLDFRTSPTFAVHPELSVVRRVSGPAGSDMIWYTFGLGFKWGALPTYADVSAK